MVVLKINNNMRKIVYTIMICLSSLFCAAQETTVEYYFPVLAKCTSYERQYFFEIDDVHFEEPNTVYPNLILYNALYTYDAIPLVATITEDNIITITSSKYTEEGDYNGTGIITKDYLSLDYTISWENSEYVETCHMESIPELFVFSNPKKYGTISPNPVKDILTLTLPTDNNEIKIFDLQGKLFLQQNIGQTAEVNVSMLQNGVYVLVVNGESYKFVKE